MGLGSVGGLRVFGLGLVRVTLTRVSPRRLDGDNLASAFKAVRDGVADALGRNDGDSEIDWRYEQRQDRDYGVEIRIQALWAESGG